MAGIIIRPRLFTPEDYGAAGDGATDDTVALQAALTAAAGGGKVLLGNRVYRITDELNVPASVAIEGVGVHTVRPAYSAQSNFDCATGLLGSVVRQDTAAKNVLNVSAAAGSSFLRDFGMTFGAAIRHRNTGHGVYGVPSTNYLSGHDHGVYEGEWRNIVVLGHDGNHYGFYTVNPILLDFFRCHSYGGGGIFMECDSYAGNYGNAVFDAFYACLYCLGTAHAGHFKGRATASAGLLNLITMNRPQFLVRSTNLFPGETTPPAEATQWGLRFDANVSRVDIIGLDVEPTTAKVTLPTVSFFETGSGIAGDQTGISRNLWKPANVARAMKNDLSIEGAGYYDYGASAYVLAPRPGLGTSPGTPGLVATTMGDHSGTITFGSGTAVPAGPGQLVRVTPHQTRLIPRIMVTPGNAATAALGLYVTKNVSGANLTSFDVCCTTAPAASQAAATYAFDFACHYGA